HGGAELALAVPSAEYVKRAGDERALERWLGAIDQLGFAVLHGVPTERGTVCAVVELFGHVRETNYGRSFDVRSVPDPLNLADTSLGLGLHTDNPYRDPVPTLQLLHCLAASATGGGTILVDGFHAVGRLRELRPHAVGLLAAVSVRYEYASPHA